MFPCILSNVIIHCQGNNIFLHFYTPTDCLVHGLSEWPRSALRDDRPGVCSRASRVAAVEGLGVDGGGGRPEPNMGGRDCRTGRILQLCFSPPPGVHMHLWQSPNSAILDQECRPRSMYPSSFQYKFCLFIADSVGLSSRLVDSSCSLAEMAGGSRSLCAGGADSERLWWNHGVDRIFSY